MKDNNNGSLVGTVPLEEYETHHPSSPASLLPFESEDHARIVPVNNSARRAFHAIASLKPTDPGWNAHHQKFICVHGDTERNNIGDTENLLNGYYRLNLAILPRKFAFGWMIGTGRKDLKRYPDGGVDLMLSDNGARDDVRGRHARIYYHPRSKVLMIEALPGKTVILNGEQVRTEGKLLSAFHLGLTIGNLTYRLEFTRFDEAKYRVRLRELFLECDFRLGELEDAFDLTPAVNHYELRGYQFQTPQAAGTFGVVSPCLKISSGEIYAVKRIQRTRRTRYMVQDELNILEHLGKHPNLCSLLDTLYSDGDQSTLGSRRVNDVYLILEPFAPLTFRQFVASEDKAMLDSIFHQCAQGLRYIHDRHVIHRDIKLDNLLVTRSRPLRAVITDFGQATLDQNSTDHFKGTLEYLAPEILALKNLPAPVERVSNSRGWSKASDVFSYGVVGYELYHGVFNRSQYTTERGTQKIVDKNIHNLLVSKLKSGGGITMDSIIAEMLASDVSERPAIADVLLKSVWPVEETSTLDGKRKNSNR